MCLSIAKWLLCTCHTSQLEVKHKLFSIRNAWFTRVFLIKGLFSIGSLYFSDFKSMYLTRLDKCKYFDFVTPFSGFFVRKVFVSNIL